MSNDLGDGKEWEGLSVTEPNAGMAYAFSVDAGLTQSFMLGVALGQWGSAGQAAPQPMRHPQHVALGESRVY